MSIGPKNQLAREQQQITLNIKDMPSIICDKCGNHTFEQLTLMKRVSALVSPTGKESILPIPVFGCNACGHVNVEFLPNDMVDEED